MIRKLLIILFLILSSVTYVNALDRCQDYVVEVRNAALKYLGGNFPYHYNIGCMITESNCRANITSFDGGIGLFQFTPSTGVLYELKNEFPNANPRNPETSINAQAYYINRIIKYHLQRPNLKFKKKYDISPKKYSDKCGLRLSDAYRYYNGGYWFIYESKLDNYTCDKDSMREHCVRGGTWVGSGKNRRYLNFCDVNYDYPGKIYKYSQKYKITPDKMSFW